MSFLNRFLDGQPQDDTLSSVVRNLRYLLNSRRNYGSYLRDFGLGEYLARTGTQFATAAIMFEVLQNTRDYEPRLLPIEMVCIGDGQLPMAFELRAELLHEAGREPVRKRQRCRLAILFDPIYGEVAVHALEGDDVR